MGEIWRVLLPLYGYKSSGAYWFREILAFIESLGFIQNPLEVCTFRRLKLDGTFCQLVLVVDDYCLSGPQHLAEKY